MAELLVKESGYDHRSKGSKEVIEKSETEPVIETGTTKALDVASKLAAQWKAREKRDGKKVWVCPMEPARSRPHFPTKAACQKYMNENFKARIEQAKLEKKLPTEYTPQQVVLSPKRTIADFVLPGQAERVSAARASAATVQQLSRAKAGNGTEYTAGVLVNMLESEASTKVAGLGDGELTRTIRQAYFRSKTKLFRAAKAEAVKRGIKVAV